MIRKGLIRYISKQPTNQPLFDLPLFSSLIANWAKHTQQDLVVVWFGLVLWHINRYRSYNAKSILYIYIKFMISKYILQIAFLNKPLLIFFHTVKWFHLFLSNMNNSIHYQPITNSYCNITDGRCRQSVKVSRDERVWAEWPAKFDVILK